MSETQAEKNLRIGNGNPYDANDMGEVRSGDWADRIARGIVSNLLDRGAIKTGFHNVDIDVRCEIIETLAAIVREGTPETTLSCMVEITELRGLVDQYERTFILIGDNISRARDRRGRDE